MKLAKLKFAILFIFLFSVLAYSQNFFYHLMPKLPVVNFTLATQNANESIGLFAPDWVVGLNSWDKRVRIDINPVTTALTNFPLLIKLDSSKINYAHFQAAAQDLRFVDASGNPLSYEIENWNSSGESNVWVKIPTLPASPTVTTIWMYYGNGSAIDAQTPTSVWDANHMGVWHLNANANDSTSNVKHGTVTGSTLAVGKNGNGYNFAGGTNNIRLPDSMVATSTVGTFELMFKTSGSNFPLLSWNTNAYPGTGGSYVPVLYVGQDGKLRGEQWIGSLAQITTSQVVNDNQWHQVVLAFGGGSHSMYLDGAYVGNVNGTISTWGTTVNYLGFGDLGGRPSTSGVWVAASSTVIDEIKFSSTKRSADWILQTYNAEQDNTNVFFNPEVNSSSKINATLQLSSAYPQNVTVPYVVSGTSTSGTDHSLTSGNAVIPAGTTTYSIPIRIFNDSFTEGNETIIVSIGTPTNGKQGVDIPVQTVTILDDPNVVPVATNDNVNITSFVPVSINVLSNDTDANGDALSIQSFTNPTVGTIVRSGKTFYYTPSVDFPATDSFTYVVSDKRGGTSTGTVTITYQIPFTWTGVTDANWNTGTNWFGGAVPGAGNMAYFNNQCTANCNPNMNAAVSVAGISLNSSFSGTITQATGISVTVGTGGWAQRAGTFAGSNANITIGNSLLIYAGTYQATSAILRINGGGLSVLASSVFQANGGTLYFGCTYALTCTINTNASAYNNVTFAGYYSWFSLAGTTMNVGGLLSVGDTYGGGYNSQPIDNGQINASGNVSVINTGYRGNAVVNIVGNASGQTITGISGMYLPGLNIVAGSNNVTFSNAINVSYVYNLTSVGTLTVAGSTLGIYCGYAQTCNINPGSANYNNFSIVGSYTTYNFGGATVNVNGDLNIGDVYSSGYTSQPINNGTFLVQGNVIVSNQGYRGTAVVNSIGTGPKSISYVTSAGFPGATFTINKSSTADLMTLSNAFALNTASQSLNVQQGTLNLAGYGLTVSGALTVGAAGKVLCNGGTITAGSTIIVGEVSCGTSIGITWTGAAGDNLWSTAGNWTNNNIPGASDIAIFNGMCTGANCNVTIPAGLSVKGFRIDSTYSGTITQPAAVAFTVGTSGWTQAAGTFVGGNSTVTLNGPFSLTGGIYTATSGLWTAGGTAFTISGSPTFNHNSGSINYTASVTITPGTTNYNNVTFGGFQLTVNLNTGTMNIVGLLTLSDTGTASYINNGTINAYGNVTATSYGKSGTSILRIVGSANQTISATSGAIFPKFQIVSTGGTVTLSGTLSFYYDYTYISGTVDTTGTTIIFAGPNGSSNSITPGTFNYNNVSFVGYQVASQLNGGLLNVLGTLLLADTSAPIGTLSNGTINAFGNITVSSQGKLGSIFIKAVGTANQTITGAGGYFPRLEIASTGGTVTLAGTINVYYDYVYTSGVVDATGSTLSFVGASGNFVPGSVSYNNVTLAGYNVATNLNAGTLNVLGTLTLADTSSPIGTVNNGTINAYGNITVSSQGKLGTAILKANGSGNQTLTGSGGYFPRLEIASTGGTVSLVGTLNIYNDYALTSGTINAGTSTLTFVGGSSTVTPGSANYNNVTFGGYNVATNLNAGSINVLGLLSMADTASPVGSVTNGTINSRGNVGFVNQGKAGSAVLNFVGATNSTLSFASTSVQSLSTTHVVNKTGAAKVSLIADTAYSVAGRNFTITSGNLDMAGYDFSVNNVLTIGASGTLTCNGGDFTAGTLTNSGTISCPGYATYPFNWTGATTDGNWNTAGNWQGGVIPTSTDIPVFDNAYCGANCNATLSGATSIKGIQLKSGYTGTITQGSGNTLTIGKKLWTQAGGAFTGGNSNISIASAFLQTGGTFTSTSGTLSTTFLAPTTVLADMFIVSGAASFVHNNGKVVLAGVAYTCGNSQPRYYRFTAPSASPLYDLELNGSIDTCHGTIPSFQPSGSTTTVLNSFTHTRGNFLANLATDAILLSGNLIVASTATNPAGSWVWPGKIKFIGTAAQEYSVGGSGRTGHIEIDKTGGSVSYAAGTTALAASQFTLTQGAFTAPSGTFDVRYFQSGAGNRTGTIFKVATGTTFSTNSGNVLLRGVPVTCGNGQYITYTVDVPSGFNFYGLDVDATTDTCHGSLTSIQFTNTTNVTNVLALTRGQLVGTGLVAQGNVSVAATFPGGTGAFAFGGSASQNLSVLGTMPAGAVTVNKAGGDITQTSSVTLTGGNLAITAGSWLMSGYALTVPGLTLAGNTLTKGTGVLTVGGSLAGTGSLFGGTVNP